MSFCLDKKKCSFSFGVVCSYKPTSKQKKKKFVLLFNRKKKKKVFSQRDSNSEFWTKKKKGGGGDVLCCSYTCTHLSRLSYEVSSTRDYSNRKAQTSLPAFVCACVCVDGRTALDMHRLGTTLAPLNRSAR